MLGISKSSSAGLGILNLVNDRLTPVVKVLVKHSLYYTLGPSLTKGVYTPLL